MVFDPDTEYMITLNSATVTTGYSQNLQYIIDLAGRTSGGGKKGYVALTGAGDPQNNSQSGVAGFKQSNPQLSFTAYFGKRDKSNGTLQEAINNDDLVASSFDNRFDVRGIQDVDTAADEITVSGDYTERATTGDTIVIDGSTGNDGLYNIDSLNYDAGNNNTVVGVAGDLNDSTADGFVSDGVKNVVEQKVWLEEYVFDGGIGEEYFLRGQEYEEGVGSGKGVVIRNAEIVRSSSSPMAGNGVLQTREGFSPVIN